MSIGDEKVDTETLRWLADRHERTAKHHLKEMERAKRDGDSWRHMGERDLRDAHSFQCRTLRALATRIDKKRMKGGDS